jgi:cysteine desulfurase / selenocysteine lyase
MARDDRDAAVHAMNGADIRELFPGLMGRHRSTIVSVPVDDTEAAMARLRAANVVASVRAGRVRLSVHFYNLEEDLDRVAELLGSA